MPAAFNPYSISSVAGFVQQMTPEQKQAPETHLRENAVRSAPNPEALSALLTTHYTGSELMISDPQTQADRRILSENAWQAMLAQVAANAVIDRPAGVKHHFGNLFRPDGNEEDRMLNEELRQAMEIFCVAAKLAALEVLLA